jgi:hypothetical protein
MPWNLHPRRSNAWPDSLKANPSLLRRAFMLLACLLLSCSATDLLAELFSGLTHLLRSSPGVQIPSD